MPRRALAVLLTVPTLAVVAAPQTVASAADGPTCHGRVATIVGTAGDDQLVGTDGPDVIVGLAGNDRIWAARGNDLVCGGPGADDLTGGRGDDALHGGLDQHVTESTAGGPRVTCSSAVPATTSSTPTSTTGAGK